MECTVPPLFFLHYRPFSCLRRTLWDVVKEVENRGGKQAVPSRNGLGWSSVGTSGTVAGWLKSLQCSDAVNLASVRSSVVQPLLQLIKILLMNIIIKVYFNCCMSSRFDVELVR